MKNGLYQKNRSNFTSIGNKLGILLTHLECVKNTGSDKWLAKCPAHQDRSPSLSIKLADDRILIHCFAGCSVDDVLGAVDLDMADLFPDRPTDPYVPQKKPPRFSAYELFPLLVQEASILALAWNDTFVGKTLSDEDYQRVTQAYQCVMRLYAEVSQ